MSYPSNRKQYVDFKGIKSNIFDIINCVPQGSILGPLLFIIFINGFSKSSNLFDFVIHDLQDDSYVQIAPLSTYTCICSDIYIFHFEGTIDSILYRFVRIMT